MTDAETFQRMERMYRPQIGLYDLTRKPYLLGRDRLIATMPLASGDLVCEVGCGTGRNLERLARRDPTLRLFGLDASATMLERARQRRCATLAHGLAEALDPKAHFGLEQPFDRIVLSYALSMIPDWRGSIAQSLSALRSGGTLAIVDFGDQQRWPSPMKRGLRAWLSLFDVYPVDDLAWHLKTREAGKTGRLDAHTILGGYAQILIFEKA